MATHSENNVKEGREDRNFTSKNNGHVKKCSKQTLVRQVVLQPKLLSHTRKTKKRHIAAFTLLLLPCLVLFFVPAAGGAQPTMFYSFS